MLKELIAAIPPDLLKILLTLFLSSLLGLEREEQRARSAELAFGGIRAFPLIGLTGYALALFSGPEMIPFSVGFLAVGSLLFLSYRHKIAASATAGMTTEISALITFALGGLIFRNFFWVASTLVVFSLLLLELKIWLERISQKIPADEILTFTKFLLLTVVVLPIVPDESFGPFQINPFKTWLIVVATSTISYASYLIQKSMRGQGGVLLAALLGGAYSSTVTTVVLAKKAKDENRANLFNGAILAASGMMYLRIAILIGLFNMALFKILAPVFLALSILAIAVGAAWSRRKDAQAEDIKSAGIPSNPLEIHTAVLFGGFFVAMMAISQLAVHHLGQGAVFGLATLMGLTDVDPFIMGMTQAHEATLTVAASAILIAAASNNALKGVYAYSFSKGRLGNMGLLTLWLLSSLGLLPLIWI